MKCVLIISLACVASVAEARGETAGNCGHYLSLNDDARRFQVKTLDLYANGFRDGLDIICPEKPNDQSGTDGSTETDSLSCMMASGAKSYLALDDNSKMAVIDKGCRAERFEETRTFVIKAILDRMQ